MNKQQRQRCDLCQLVCVSRSRSDELFDVINLIAFKHMLARPRDIGYYRKRDDRSSLCILCWINLTVHPRQNRLYVKGMRFYDSNCQSITVYLPKIIQRPPWCLEICYVLSQNDCITHFQILSSALLSFKRYISRLKISSFNVYDVAKDF